MLPSPNGSALSLAAGDTPVLTGCLRNARAVAAAVAGYGHRVAVIAAGERWPAGGLRPAWEDLVGAGAIIAHLPGAPSPEARAARAAYADAYPDLPRLLAECGSGREIIERGFAHDVALAAEVDVSAAAPTLVEGAFVDRAV